MLPNPFVLPAGVVVEDTDAQVKYSGGWYALLSNGGYSGGRLTLTNDSTASVSFTFTGTHVYYFSDRNADHGRYSITLDGGSPVEQTSYNASLQFVQILFEKEVPAGKHTITLKNLEARTLALDFFMYLPLGVSSEASSSTTAAPKPVSTSSSSSSTPPPVATTTTTVFTTITTSSSSIVASPTPAITDGPPIAATVSTTSSSSGIASGVSVPPPPVNHNVLPAGAIVGIVLGALAVLVFGGLAAFILISRYRRARTQVQLEPFPLSPPPQAPQMHQRESVVTRPPSYQPTSESSRLLSGS